MFLFIFLFCLLLTLLCILLQFAALTWYTLSYIPFGQATVKRLGRRYLKQAGVELPAAESAASPAAGAG